ncbi:adenosylcobinamide-GDP ribazoletransferase [Dinoroseobacter sp. S76]|uniref:adenosylcobinamide-GDP ribazoletransferase n=1 Tax=Dinoroseobacter sp. S76 TaxID=3415124 RepID=UPI003C7B196D
MSRPQFRDLPLALSLLSRLPVPVDHSRAGERAATAAWAYPLVGAGLAALAGGLAWALSALGLPPGPVAGLVLVTQVMLTGALHEDGLADSADGLWGGWEPARRLEIMRDSRIGAYGVLALGLSLLLRWACLVAILDAAGPGGLIAALVAVAALSRGAMVTVMHALPFARSDGLAHRVGSVPRWSALLAVALALGVCAMLWGPLGSLLLAGVGGLSALVVGRLALSRIGGQTGDILGATQQVAEISALLALTTLI